uniref:Uncharacterized protein n=1 Tax=Hippocampus comes TaxID=109280 RepID=A0A3Q2XW85_HIPCM
MSTSSLNNTSACLCVNRCPIFCLTCGTLAPHAKAPADGGQVPRQPNAGRRRRRRPTDVLLRASVSRCVACGATLKFQSTLTCVPEAHILCACCGRGSPADLSHCLTCDSRLAPCAQEDSHEANPAVGCGLPRRPQRRRRRFDIPPRQRVCARPQARRRAQTSGTRWPSGTDGPRAPRTAVSPGRGYWRNQLDHVCAHLRSFAQNDAPFRTLLGEPRLGRVRAGDGPRRDVRDGSRAGDAPRPVTSFSKDVQLLQELGPGRGRVGVVRRLLDQVRSPGRRGGAPPPPPRAVCQRLSVLVLQGADPNCRGGAAAAIAAINGHHAVLPLLLQRGADIDRRSGPRRLIDERLSNEHAERGLSFPKRQGGLAQSGRPFCFFFLFFSFSCNAATGVRNGDGLTPYDVAIAGGCGDMMSLLGGSASLGGAELTPGSNSSRVA